MSRAVPTRYGRVSPLTPNWRRGVEETYEFKTDVIEVRDGLEMRAALRENPRYSMEMRCQVIEDEIKRYLGDLAESQHLPFFVPVGWRRVFLTASAAAGNVALSVSDAPFWLVPGCRLVISGQSQVEAVEVLSVVGTTVTLTQVLEGTFATGSTVYLAFYGRATDDIDFRAETATFWQGRVTWERDPGADPWPELVATPTLYNDYEVFLHRPNWRTQPRISIQQSREMVDSSRGVVAVSAPTGESQLEFRLLYSGFSANVGDELIAFFLRMKGKRGAFYMPTWQQDIAVESGTGNRLDVIGEDAFYAYGDSRVFNTVAARHADGTYQINRVTAAAIVGGETHFTMSEAWSSPLTSDSLVMWCPLWRFATDRLEVQRDTGTVTDMTFSVMSLVQEAV